MEGTSAKHPLCHQPSLALHFFLSFLPSNVPPPEQTNSCATKEILVPSHLCSFHSPASRYPSCGVTVLTLSWIKPLQAVQLLPVIPACLHAFSMSISSWLYSAPFYPTCSSVSPFSCLCTQFLHLPTVHLSIPAALKPSFVLHNTHQSIFSLAPPSFAACWHFSSPPTTAPLPLPGGSGAPGDKCPAPLLPGVWRCACAGCWRLSWLAEGSTAVRCAPLQPNTPVSPRDACQ